ncbi:MAG: Fpg/Nei family DNA glycosylase [Promethearchaeota archaeon]
MPELPEVETFKRYFDNTSLKQVITKVKIIDNRVLNTSDNFFKKSIVNKQFESTSRHGKHLFIYLNPNYLIMHFGMTGDLEYYSKEDDEPKFSKVIFQFENGFNLAYTSQRMFGRLEISKSIEDFIKKKKLGPDAFKMSLKDFQGALKRRSAIAKNALLNQSFIAGIGNLYSDEILFRTKLHPKSKLDNLDEEKINKLFTNIKEVLQFGIEKEGDLSTYPDDFIIPHRKKEEHCPICNKELAYLDISGRRSFFCPNCQKERRE